MFSEDEKDHLADFFWRRCKASGQRFSTECEEQFISKVAHLVESGLSLIDAKRKAFDFVSELQP